MGRIGFGATFKLHNGTALTACGEVTSVTAPFLEGEAVEDTHHGSAGGVRTFVPGLLKPSEIEIEINLAPGDATHLLLVAQVAARTARAFELFIPNASTGWKYTGTCIPLAFMPDTPMDGKMTGKFKAQVSGAITETAGP